MATMDCPLRSGHDLAEAYVAGTLPEAEQDAFEQHYFACPACFSHVQILQDVRRNLESLSPGALSQSAGRQAWWQAGPWAGLAVAAALIVAIGWWWRNGPPFDPQPTIARQEAPAAPAPAPATSPAPAPAAPPDAPIEAPTRAAQLRLLATIVPPRYVPLTVRGGDAPPRAGSFDAAMTHYVAGRYGEAATALAALGAAQPNDPGIAFFEGVSALAVGRIEDAREGLTRAIAADVQPYEDEAHFYLAKVYLAEGAVDLAKLELEYARTHEAGPEGEAARLLAAIAKLPAR
jgi:TolA-binding protein